MKNKDEFFGAIGTLLHSWGSDTPQEVIWGLNEMVDWFEKEYNVKIEGEFWEPYDENFVDPDVVMEEMKSKV